MQGSIYPTARRLVWSKYASWANELKFQLNSIWHVIENWNILKSFVYVIYFYMCDIAYGLWGKLEFQIYATKPISLAPGHQQHPLDESSRQLHSPN